MKVRRTILVLLGLIAAGVWFFWPHAAAPVAEKSNAPLPVTNNNSATPVIATNPPVVEDSGKPSAASTNRLAFRVTNTPRSIGELTRDAHAILLENAFIDTTAQLNLKIPSHLRAGGEPGAYLVQSRGAIDGAFRAALAGAGATIVSYIPNNAFLVQISAAGATMLQENSRVQAVLPYEPYYKVQSSLLGLAMNQKPLPAGTYLTLGIFSRGAESTVAQIEKLGAQVMARERSPFGSVVRVRPPADWIALANLPGVQLVEPTHLRIAANDLTRVATGVSTNTTNLVNYLNLSGLNVTVEVNDTGIDPTHPDFAATVGGGLTRVSGDFTNSLTDADGHGTHVAGIIAGNGAKSSTINFTTSSHGPRGSVTNANFRGKAPLAKLFSVGFLGNDFFATSDSYLQEAPALTNALISNNSWINDGDNNYDLSAASYDAAVRDALPETTGPQPVLFVFAAGNDGGGADNGGGGGSDTILSPGTAKNVVTVGALESARNITNTYKPLYSTNETLAWQGETDTGSQVAGYSARGNVGVQTEGTFGRFKPDVVAPGTFIVSTRSSMWDEKAYYNPTNYDNSYSEYGLLVQTNLVAYGGANVPLNAVSVTIQVVPNKLSPQPFPILPIYISATGVPIPTDPTTYDFASFNNVMSIPPGGGSLTSISMLANGGFTCAVADGTNFPVNFDLIITIATTNDLGNQLEVLSNLNNSIGGDPDSLVPPHYYRYETGTSMAAPAVSGGLALMQDFFTNTLHSTPSPALLKAMLINGARLTSGYNKYGLTNSINLEGWGLINVPNSIPAALTNISPSVTNTPFFFVDQSPTNTLATGDRRTYLVTVPSAAARSQPLRVTLAWTDPPGNPAAAIKLVNDLDLVVSNLDNGRVYYANNFASSGTPPFSIASTSNSIVSLDAINNVENVYISSTLSTNYSVTVTGHAVNVNAVTAEQTNIVQDFALVIASGDGNNTNGVSITSAAPGYVPSIAPNVTFLPSTNGIYFNQVSGANAPWLSTNDITFGTNSVYATNSVFHIGQTNQWHFYVVTNTTIFTNAAFIVFLPNTLAIPRQGVFADSVANSTRPEADLEMLVASAPDANAGLLTNFNQTVISNCLFKVNGDSSSTGRGGTEFVAYSNSAFGQIYYIGVQCQDQMAGQFGFIPIFSQEPFSTTDSNGNEYVRGLLLPAAIPDGNNAHPGVGYIFGLALTPIDVRNVIVTNSFSHQNFGDLIGSLSHGSDFAVLNNHDGLGVVTPAQQFIYDDSGQGNVPGAMHTDGPGSLNNFRGKQGIGPWLMTQVDDSQSQTGSVTGFSFKIEPHRDLRQNPYITVTVPAQGWFYDYIDVPVGYTNLLAVATNLPPTSSPPIQLYLNYNDTPGFSNFLARVELTNGIVPGNSISYGPPLIPGRYFVGLYNPDTAPHDVLIGVTLAFSASAITTVDWSSSGSLALLDDAVTYDSMFVTNRELMQTFQVGLRVDHPRISDLVFHLISPDGSRYLLMENRGGQSTNGCGANYTVTNIIPAAANGGREAATNTFDTGVNPGTITINYDFFSVPDQMAVYNGGVQIFDSGFVNHSNTVVLNYSGSSVISIVMNPNGNSNATAWVYTVFAPRLKYAYLSFTEDTNLTTTPIKFAPPPFVPLVRTNVSYQTNITFTTNVSVVSLSDFEAPAAGEYLTASTVDGWTVASNQVSLVSDPVVAQAGNKYLALASGSIFRNLTTVSGGTNVLKYAYRGPGAVSLWRGEGNMVDPISGNNGVLSNDLSYAAGKVNSTFNMGTSGFVLVPASPSMDIGSGSGLTIDAWVDPTAISAAAPNPIVEWSQNGGFSAGLHFYVSSTAFDQAGCLYGGFIQSNNAAIGNGYTSAANIVTNNGFQHVALTYNHSSGLSAMYLNGVMVASQNINAFSVTTPWTTGNLLIGRRINKGSPSQNFHFSGYEDEVSIYRRELSVSEIKAIYQKGGLGKYNASAPSIAQGLAEAQVTLNGVSQPVFYGNNTNWQTNTFTFVATTNAMVIKIDGLQPGMLLDSFTLASFTAVTNIVTNTTIGISNLYYLPEQSLDPVIRTSPFGEWQLEILDNRAGAAPTNPPPQLLSWQLEFQIANTNAVSPPVFTNTFPTNGYTIIESNLLVVTNSATPGRTNLILTYYLLDPPAGCTIGTNTGVITWIPDESQGPSTNTITTVVYDNSSPANYSTNSFIVIVLETNLPPRFLFPTNTTVISNLETVYYTANCVATDPDLPFNTVTFQLLSPTNLAGLTVTTNGVITWTPDETNGPSTNFITIVATDTNPPAINQKSFSITNTFTFIVLESNVPPVLPFIPDTNIFELQTLTVTNTATDADFPTNPLRYSVFISVNTNAMIANGFPLGFAALLPAPVIDTNGVITWTPSEFQGPAVYTITTIVTDTNPPAVNAKSLSATNTFNVTVNEINLPPSLSLSDTNILELFPWSETVTATDPDFPTNQLTYALVSGPPGLTVTTNGVISWLPTAAQAGTSNLVVISVTDSSPTAPSNPSFTVTNSFTIYVIYRQPAFPGAEGAGTFAVGGRGGDVYHVINLNDSGPGSLRFGITSSTNNRTIVFDLSGTITNLTDLKITNPNITIAGQTAPGDGITIKGLLTSVQNTHDIVVRFMRFRPGDINCPTFQDDSFHFDRVTNSIVDHLSASWSIDEVLSTTDSTNITVQWSMITDALNNSCHVKGLHGYGSLLRYGYGAISYHHNLYADNYSRNPRPGDNIQLDFVNNVVFNWGIMAGYNEDDSADNPGGYTNALNYIGNYFIAGTDTTSHLNTAFDSGVPSPANTQIYQSGNLIDNNAFAPLNGVNTGAGMFSGLYTPLVTPVLFQGFPVTTNTAVLAYEQVLDFVGAWQNRDAVDTNIVGGVRYKSGKIIDSQNQVGGWPVLRSTAQPLDTDQDGMPDFWEITLLTNPTVPNNNHTNADGYTDLEHYNNWLAAPHALTVTNTPVDVDLFVVAGHTGNLTFGVINGTNGTVTLTSTVATFTPAANYSGFASFGFFVTNNDTGVSFGPVTVSVLVSLTNATYLNTAPFWTNGFANVTMDEQTIVTITNTATDLDIPTNTLTYSLTNSPAWANIDTNTGVITLAPQEVDGPSTNTITVVVTDNGVPPLSSTTNFVVIVNEVNLAPFWATNVPSQTNYLIDAYVTLVVTNTASDLDIPTNKLTYQLISPTPAGVTIDTNTGIITWRPTNADVGNNTIATVVTDFNPYALTNQSLSATNYFTVMVNFQPGFAPFAFTEPATLQNGSSAQLNGFATPNGAPTTTWFEWGTSSGYGLRTPPLSIGTNYDVVYVTNAISGLLTNVPYHFRLVVSNAFAVTYGFDQIFDQAKVVAWGLNDKSQTNVPVGLTNAIAVAGGGYSFGEHYSLALSYDGTVAAWGGPTLGQTNFTVGLNNAVSLSVGGFPGTFGMALKSDGSVVASGDTTYRQANVPVGLTNVVFISGGTFHSLALKRDGTVVAWGAGTNNTGVSPDYGQSIVPAGLSNVVAVAAGGSHSLALKNDGTVEAWGDNTYGQLNVPGGLTNVVGIAAGSYHSLALKNDGSVMAWGAIGNAQDHGQSIPPGLSNVVVVSAGGLHSVAVKNDGSAVGWGDNTYGQANVPVGVSNVVSIAAGYSHNVALTSPFNINPLNQAPFWTNGFANVTMNEQTVVTITNLATDPDGPTNVLVYMLTNSPAWATINSSNGIITLAPGEADGPATNLITVVVTDNGLPPKSAATNFTVIVNEVNTAPFWAANVPSQSNYAVNELTLLTVTNTASDSDVPTNQLTYSLSVSPTVLNAVISAKGIITWTPTEAQGPGVYIFTTIVTDTNPYALFNKSLSATNTFTVTVNEVNSRPIFILTPPNRSVLTGTMLVITNRATDSDAPTNILTYSLLNPPVGASIDPSSGVLTLNLNVGTNLITTVVTDNGVPPLSATNFFTVIVTNSFVPPTNMFSIFSIVQTNISGSNGFLITWFAPTNTQFHLQWTPLLVPSSWQNFKGVISFDSYISATNSHFSYFDDGSQTGGFGPTRFYRLLLLNSPTNTPPEFLNTPPDQFINPSSTLIVTNSARDYDVPAQLLVYFVTNSLAGTNAATISTNGVITWTPTPAQSGQTNIITTIVTDNGVPAKSATNFFSVVVSPALAFNKVFLTPAGVTVQWTAPTNQQFNVQWATNLVPVINWFTFPDVFTSTNGTFSFTDTNAPLVMKFYRLLLLP